MPPKRNQSVESLFIPGQQLAQEADNLAQQIRNCGARLNRLKLARAAPDAPIWWQFLSNPDGSSESLDRTAAELQHVLRELEHTTSELKRLCLAPASDVAGNVQREMEKKKWAITTIDKWCAVLKDAASGRAGKGREEKLRKREELKQQRKLEREQQQQQKSSSLLLGETIAEGSVEQQQQHDIDEDGNQLSKVQGTYPLEMTARRREVINSALAAMNRIEKLQDELESTESKCNAALKLSQKFRDLDHLETRFANVKTRRRQFQEQVHAHLSEIGKEIEKEAKMRTQNAREYYDEHHLKHQQQQRKIALQAKQQQQQQQHSDPSSMMVTDNNNIDNNHAKSHHGDCERCASWRDEIERLEHLKRSKWVDRAVRILCTQAELEKENNIHTHEKGTVGRNVPTHRILALVGSDKEAKRPAVIRPLFSRRITKPSIASSQNNSHQRDAYSSSMTFDLPASLVLPKHQPQSRRSSEVPFKFADAVEEKRRKEEEEEQEQQQQRRSKDDDQKVFEIATSTGCAPGVEWTVPSAHDHTKSWKVRLCV